MPLYKPGAVRTQLFDLGDVVVHQLLCGREIANKRRNPPEDGALWRVWEFAESMRNFVYLVVDVQAQEALVLDACWDIEGIFKYAASIGAKVTSALFTHAHFDHTGGLIPTSQTGGVQLVVGGVKDMVERGVPVWAGEQDAAIMVRQCQVDPSQIQVVQEGECLKVGSAQCMVISTPGHTPGSVCLHVPPTGRPGSGELSTPGVRVVAKDGALLSGDTLFVQGCGRTDTPEANQDHMMQSLSRLIQGLPAGCIVCPGHDYASDPYTTVGDERTGNQMVCMGVQAYKTPAPLPDFATCSCVQRMRKTAAELMAPPELKVFDSRGGTLLLDGVPTHATAADLRETVLQHVNSLLGDDQKHKRLQSADGFKVLDGSGSTAIRDDMALRQVPTFGRGFVVDGASLPRDCIRRPWFPQGSEIVLDGLQSAPELNGQPAVVSEWMAEKGRYEVLVTAVGIRDIKHVKPDNLRRKMAAPVAPPFRPEGFGGGGEEQDVDEHWRVVFSQKVVVRAEPSTSGRILDSRKPGDRVHVCRRRGEWVQLHPSEGFGPTEAWLLTDGAAKGLGRLLACEDAAPAPKLEPRQPEPEPLPAQASGGYPQSTAAPKARCATPPVAGKPRPPAAGAAAASRAKRLAELQEELERVEMEKAAAIEDEDYDLAAELKQQKRELEAQIQEVENSADDSSAERLKALQEELQQVKRGKLEAVEEENFLEASTLRRRQLEIEAEMHQLEG